MNAALHIVAVCQVRYGGEGGDYYWRKLAEGKSRISADLEREISAAA